MKNILVTGVGGPAGKSVAGLLLERGFTIIGTDMQPLRNAEYPFIQVPPARDPDFIAAIRAIALEQAVDLIVPTVSEELPVFARDWGLEKPRMWISSAQAVEIANDKYLTATTLATHGVSVPRFMLPSDAVSCEAVEQAVGWPCVSKPRIGRGGREVQIRQAKDLPEIQSLGNSYILQEFASGRDYAPNVFASINGHSLAIVLEKTELKEGMVGNAKSVRRVEDSDVAQTALEAARAVRLTGPLDIDIRRLASGRPVVLEINARFGANIRFAPEVLDAALSQAE